MSFPATYNISYYHGDTLELEFAPKQADGSAFSLSGYAAAMAIALVRGGTPVFTLSSSDPAQIVIENDTIKVTMSATLGASLDATKGYVYDLQISKSGKKYTIVTGNITITEDITA